MQELTFTIEYVKDGFMPFKEGVKLLFEDNESTQPMPRTKRCMQALREQHPEIIAEIPVHHISRGFPYLCGLCFTVTGRRRRENVAKMDVTYWAPSASSRDVHPHSFFE